MKEVVYTQPRRNSNRGSVTTLMGGRQEGGGGEEGANQEMAPGLKSKFVGSQSMFINGRYFQNGHNNLFLS